MGTNCDVKVPEKTCDCKHGRCVRYYANMPRECICDSGWYGEDCSRKLCVRNYIFNPVTDECEPGIKIKWYNFTKYILREKPLHIELLSWFVQTYPWWSVLLMCKWLDG